MVDTTRETTRTHQNASLHENSRSGASTGAEHDAARRSADVPLNGRTNGANGAGYPDKPLEPPADVTATQEVEKHDQAVRDQIKNADKIRGERRAQGEADLASSNEGMPPQAAPIPAYPRENPWKAGATNNGDIGRTTGFTMPLYDRRSEFQKHCEWPTVGYRPGTEPLESAYSDQEPDIGPEPWREEWRADPGPGLARPARAGNMRE